MLTYNSFPGCVKNRRWRDQDTTPSMALYSHLSRLRPSTEHLLYDSKIQARTFLWTGCTRVGQSQKNWRLVSADVVCVNYRRIPPRASALQPPPDRPPTVSQTAHEASTSERSGPPFILVGGLAVGERNVGRQVCVVNQKANGSITGSLSQRYPQRWMFKQV